MRLEKPVQQWLRTPDEPDYSLATVGAKQQPVRPPVVLGIQVDVMDGNALCAPAEATAWGPSAGGRPLSCWGGRQRDGLTVDEPELRGILGHP